MLDALVAEARVRWGLDLASGLQIVTPAGLAAFPVEPSRPLLVAPAAILHASASEAEAAPIPGRHAHGGDPLALLRRLYPGDHPVGQLGVPETTTVDALAAEALRGPLYVPPLAPESNAASPWALPWASYRLRQPDGCPWDREQTHRSLKKFLLEEAYEVYDAIDAGATAELAGELGDLLLQIVLHAQLAAEEGIFDMTDVEAAITRKIVRRHPHVFADAEAHTASDVNRQWEQIKRAEREQAAAEAADAAAGSARVTNGAANGGDDGAAPEPVAVKSALDGISRSMPALAATQEMQERAAHLGYDWPTIDGVLAKVHEELGELAEARTAEEKREELGDLLLVIVNLARKEGVEAEGALRAAADKFRRRFRRVERMARERNVLLRDLSFDELDELWDAAKAEEAADAVASLPVSGERSPEEGSR